MILTREQVRAVDRIAIEQFGVPGIVLMENAALGAVAVARAMLQRTQRPAVLILCGGGNNGGDGLAIARHLHNAGADIHIATTLDPARYTGDAGINWRIIQAMNLPRTLARPDLIRTRPWHLIIDAIFGTGLTHAPRPPFDELVAAVNAANTSVLAIDIPSGLDCDTGQPLGPVIRATRTVTFVAEKAGFAAPAAAPFLGQVHVAPIGCPQAAIDAAVAGHG
jgi:NAD(P)H-hydrate epimerase